MIYGCVCVFIQKGTSKGDPTTYSLYHLLPFENLTEKDILFLAYLSQKNYLFLFLYFKNTLKNQPEG